MQIYMGTITTAVVLFISFGFLAYSSNLFNKSVKHSVRLGVLSTSPARSAIKLPLCKLFYLKLVKIAGVYFI